MGDLKGFLKVKRSKPRYRPVCERIKDFSEAAVLRAEKDSQEQASRCMDCGTPFCHWACPIGNYIPEWNDLVFHSQWEKAYQLLAATNNFPEITGRVCPALCEYSCVLGLNDDAVTVRENELAVIEYAFSHGLVKPNPPQKRSGKRVAVVGSGPAGLACADQLNKAGHLVVVFEKADKIGGILRYGIPDFKLEKYILDRRIEILKKEGIVFNTGVDVGKGLKPDYLQDHFDAFCLAAGSGPARDLNVEGRELSGIYLAMDYLLQSNKRVSGGKISADHLLDAKNKRVVVIGGGDTGADCMGVAHRQGAACVTQIEIMPKPGECRSNEYPWPKYPLLLKTSSSHEEGGRRDWLVATKKFIGSEGKVKKIFCAKVEFTKGKGNCPEMREISNSEFEIEADLVILALGFQRNDGKGLLDQFKAEKKNIFICGDMQRGQSLIVWAIAEGREAAQAIDKYLKG